MRSSASDRVPRFIGCLRISQTSSEVQSRFDRPVVGLLDRAESRSLVRADGRSRLLLVRGSRCEGKRSWPPGSSTSQPPDEKHRQQRLARGEQRRRELRGQAWCCPVRRNGIYYDLLLTPASLLPRGCEFETGLIGPEGLRPTESVDAANVLAQIEDRLCPIPPPCASS